MKIPPKFKTVNCPFCGDKRRTLNPNWMRIVRAFAGVGQRELARKIGMASAMLCRMEQGKRQTTAKVIKAYEKLIEWTTQ